jgi:hypothetical protein
METPDINIRNLTPFSDPRKCNPSLRIISYLSRRIVPTPGAFCDAVIPEGTAGSGSKVCHTLLHWSFRRQGNFPSGGPGSFARSAVDADVSLSQTGMTLRGGAGHGLTRTHIEVALLKAT